MSEMWHNKIKINLNLWSLESYHLTRVEDIANLTSLEEVNVKKVESASWSGAKEDEAAELTQKKKKTIIPPFLPPPHSRRRSHPQSRLLLSGVDNDLGQ